MYGHLHPGDEVHVGSAGIRVRVTEQQIQERVEELGAGLRERLEGKRPVFIGLLSAGFVFVSDLIRAFGADHEVDFLKFSRYDPKQKDPTAVRVMHDLRSDIKDRFVVVAEGIRSPGTKIQYVDRFLRLHQPKEIVYCAMIKPAGAQLAVPLDEMGFEIDKEFVVGYGLDYKEHYRNLPFIGVMDSVTPGDYSHIAPEGSA